MCFLWWGKRVGKSPASLSSVYLPLLPSIFSLLSLLSYDRFRILHRLYRMYIFIYFLDSCDHHHHHFPFPDPLKNNLWTPSHESSVSLQYLFSISSASLQYLLSISRDQDGVFFPPFAIITRVSSAYHLTLSLLFRSLFSFPTRSSLFLNRICLHTFPNSTSCTSQFFDHILTQCVGEEWEVEEFSDHISFGRPKLDPFLWRRIKYRRLCGSYPQIIH